jgi:hypothetical protein
MAILMTFGRGLKRAVRSLTRTWAQLTLVLTRPFALIRQFFTLVCGVFAAA